MVHKLVMLGVGAALAAGTITAGATGPAQAASEVIWSANTGLAPAKNFEGLEESPGTITVANDPLGTYGSSFRYETWQNSDGSKARCESRGLRQPDGTVVPLDNSTLGQTVYLGWRALWDPMPIQKGAWISLFQLHIDGESGSQPQSGPFVLRTLGDGTLHFQLTRPNGTTTDIWTAPLSLNKWNSFVIGWKMSRTATGSTAGWVSFWYNGKEQTLTNGSTSYPAATLWGNDDHIKWGIYRSGANHTGHAVAYMNDGKLGSTYAAVAPTG
ncbi:MAG TPA: heparin lyase I family protein [Pseudonocardiaceae bacterium]|jgi:hypothetical protein